MFHARRLVLTVQSRRFSRYFSEFPAVNMFMLKYNNLHKVNGLDAFPCRPIIYNIQIVQYFQYLHVNWMGFFVT